MCPRSSSSYPKPTRLLGAQHTKRKAPERIPASKGRQTRPLKSFLQASAQTSLLERMSVAHAVPCCGTPAGIGLRLRATFPNIPNAQLSLICRRDEAHCPTAPGSAKRMPLYLVTNGCKARPAAPTSSLSATTSLSFLGAKINRRPALAPRPARTRVQPTRCKTGVWGCSAHAGSVVQPLQSMAKPPLRRLATSAATVGVRAQTQGRQTQRSCGPWACELAC